MELEIAPEPDEAERRAIVATLAEPDDVPFPYRSGWRREAVSEATGSADAT